MLGCAVPRGSSKPPEESSVAAELPAETSASEGELSAVTAHVKWFDATRGFGFLISDEIEGDILLHFSVLKEHGRRSLPEGAVVECIPARLPRGLQAKQILSIDLGPAVTPPPRAPATAAERADREALSDAAGEFEVVEVKWFNRVKGYGFVNRFGADDTAGEDVFLHMETVRQANIGDLQPGQHLEARIAASRKGLTAVEVRLPE
jgi:CspA family cold shock protein